MVSNPRVLRLVRGRALVLCCAWAAMCLGLAAKPPGALWAQQDRELGTAIEAFQNSDLVRAQELIRSYLANHPKSAAGWNLQGLVQDALREYDAGGRSFETALRLEPSAPVFNNLGNHSLLVGHPEEAPRAFREALRLDAHHFSARFNLISLLLNDKNAVCGPDSGRQASQNSPAPTRSVGAPTPSDSCAEQARKLFGGFSPDERRRKEVQVLWVRALVASGEQSRGIEAARAAMSGSPKDPQLAYSLGTEILAAGDSSDAIPFLKAARSTSSDFEKNPKLLLTLATAEFQAHLPAAQDFLELSRLQANWWQPYYYLGRLADEEHQFLQASSWLVKAEGLAPKEPLIAAALANVAAKQGFWLDAMDEWQRYLRLRPDDRRAGRELAVAGAMSRQEGLALDSMKRYLEAYPNDAESMFLYALIEEDDGQLEAAKATLQASLSLQPSNAAAWATLGRIALQQNDLKGAADDLQKTLQLNPRNVSAIVSLAELHVREKHPNLALPLLLEAVKLDPNNVSAYYQLVHVYRETGHREQAAQAAAIFKRLQATSARPAGGARGLLSYLRADVQLTPAERQRHYIEFLKSALETHPDDPRALCRLGIAELENGQSSEALPHLQGALQPSLPFADALKAAQALVAAHQTQRALDFDDLALKTPQAQTDARAALEKAQLLSQLGRPQEALEVLNAVPTGASPKGEAADLAGLIYARLGQDAQALAAFRVALALAPQQESFYRDAAVFLGSRGQWENASKLLDVGLSLKPSSRELALEKAILLQLSGRRAEAQATLEKIAFHADDPSLSAEQRLAGLLLAISYYTTDQKSAAARLLEELTRADPNLSQAWYYRALIASETHQPRQALDWVNRALALDAQYATALYLRGKLEKDTDQPEAAQRDLEAAVAADPSWGPPHYLLSQIFLSRGDTAHANEEQKTLEQLNAHAQTSQGTGLRDFLAQLALTAEP